MSNYGTQVAQGKLKGKRDFGVFAFSENIDAGINHDVWEGGQLTPAVESLTYLIVEEFINFASTSALDDIGSTGTHTVLCDGVNGLGKRVFEVVAMTGTVSKQTTNKYIHINSLVCVSNSVLGESNKGNITATSAISNTVQSCIITGKGASHGSHFLVPLEEDAFLHRISFTGEKGDEYRVEFIFTSNIFVGTPSQQVSIPTIFFETNVNIDFHIPKRLIGGTRLKMVARSDTGNDKGLSGTFDLELVLKED